MPTCPKCSHQQDNPDECESCGLLFGKFERRQARAKEAAPAPNAQQPRESAAPRIVAALVLMALTAALTYYFTAGRAGQERTSELAPAGREEEPASPAGAPQAPARAERSPQDLDSALAQFKDHPIDYAKNGTVAIETPWGKGAGFFITDIYVVTNKHVVTPDRSQLSEFRHKVETARRLIGLEQEKIAGMRSRLGQLQDGPSRQQVAIIIEEREKALAKVLPVQQDNEERLKNLEKAATPADIKIFLADGSEVTPEASHLSPRRDLALLTVYAGKATVLQPASANNVLQQGDKVYTIGNPIGLRNTVTAGVFSGYRKRDDSNDLFLQTDAPINPGNSGGPLIDERGFVHGINTMVIRGTQGIGFAIPIQAVLDEFSISPAQGLPR